ncbi:MAG: dihydrolipoyl dehydrogenase [Spirochaetaceae bacterium]
MYDLIVLGGGPGGYMAAERAGHLGKRVLLIEESRLGGVCLNAGCIPTKTLLNAAKIYHAARDSKRLGVTTKDATFSFSTAMKWKNRVVDTLTKGVAAQMKRFGVEVVYGFGHVVSAREVVVEGKGYEGAHLIVATGSHTAVPPIPGIDSASVMTSDEMLRLEEMPGSVAVIGGGYIGMEFASFFTTLGVPVTVVEMLDEIIPQVEPQVAAQLRKSMKEVTFKLGTTVTAIDGSTLQVSGPDGNESVEAERILLSVGRRPTVEGIGFETIGLDFDASGIRVDERMRTNVSGVYAVGDVTGKSLLAHAAYRMADVAVADIFPEEFAAASIPPGDAAGLGYTPRMRYEAVPWVVYTRPELAGCGMTASEAREAGLNPVTATVPMRMSGRYLAEHPDEQGECTLVADARTGRILGARLLGTGSSEIIFGVATMIEAELRISDVREVIFPHPTVSEVLREAAWEMEIGGAGAKPTRTSTGRNKE